MSVEIMTDANYQSLISGSKKLIIDVWADWCGPCKRTTPVFEEMAGNSPNDQVVFAKLDADNQRAAASSMKITSLPTFVIFQGGNLTKKWSGADVPRLRKEIDALIKD
jgi:thioredoxin